MAVENKFARFMRNTGPARFFVPFGLILVIFGIIILGINTDNYTETVGTVTKVEQISTFSDEPDEYEVSFTYTVDGKEYDSYFNMSEKPNVGEDITVFYDPEKPETVAGNRTNRVIPVIMIVVGAAALGYGIFKTVKFFRKSKELDSEASSFPEAEFEGFKNGFDVKEYYVRFDGVTLKPGYIVEDAERNVIFEGKMAKNSLVGPRTFEFNNHITGSVKEHEVGHTVTSQFDSGMFSESSWFKFDGKNIWDLLHERGIRIQTDIRTKFPFPAYNVAKDGRAFARIETTGMYVHEDDAAQHTVNPPARMHFRFWTESADIDTVFLTVFAISEAEQTVVE